MPAPTSNDAPPDLFVAHRRVEFVDTDMAGIVHFSRFFIFMETAEHQLREALGFPVHHPGEEGTGDEGEGSPLAGVPIGWPRVAAHCDYHRPARFGDDLAIHIGLAEQGRSSLTFTFTFRRQESGEREEASEPTVLATGRMTSVCCRLEPKVAPVPIPEAMAEKLAEALAAAKTP